jgi:hypothetical protein
MPPFCIRFARAQDGVNTSLGTEGINCRLQGTQLTTKAVPYLVSLPHCQICERRALALLPVATLPVNGHPAFLSKVGIRNFGFGYQLIITYDYQVQHLRSYISIYVASSQSQYELNSNF